MRFGATRMPVLACVLMGVLIAPAGAGAATAAVDRACYAADGNSVVAITGSGFAPGGEVQLQVGGGIVGVTSADDAGNVSTTFPVPAPPETGPSRNEKSYDISLVQGATSATATIRSTVPTGDFHPSAGSPRTLKVRFTAIGFGVQTAPGQPMPSVYVHYVDPRGKLRRTVSLGEGVTPCGTIAKTKLRKLFPFNPRRGTWTLQFDTNKTYRRATDLSRFVNSRITLTIS